MKKVFFIAMLLSVSYIGFSQSEKSVVDNSFMCQVYTFFMGSDADGCGGGKRVCCANSQNNFA